MDQEGTGLPAAGARMTIDLSPRLAQSLANRQNRPTPEQGRVIDGQMLSASELREALEQKQLAAAAEESDNGDPNDPFNNGDGQ